MRKLQQIFKCVTHYLPTIKIVIWFWVVEMTKEFKQLMGEKNFHMDYMLLKDNKTYDVNYYFLVIDTTLTSNHTLRFRKNLVE